MTTSWDASATPTSSGTAPASRSAAADHRRACRSRACPRSCSRTARCRRAFLESRRLAPLPLLPARTAQPGARHRQPYLPPPLEIGLRWRCAGDRDRVFRTHRAPANKRIVGDLRTRVRTRSPGQCYRQRADIVKTRQFRFDLPITPRWSESHNDVARADMSMKPPFKIRGDIQRRQRAFPHDDRMYEFDRDVLGVRRVRPAPEREKAPAGLESCGHLAARLREPHCLLRKECTRDLIPPQ